MSHAARAVAYRVGLSQLLWTVRRSPELCDGTAGVCSEFEDALSVTVASQGGTAVGDQADRSRTSGRDGVLPVPCGVRDHGSLVEQVQLGAQ